MFDPLALQRDIARLEAREKEEQANNQAKEEEEGQGDNEKSGSLSWLLSEEKKRKAAKAKTGNLSDWEGRESETSLAKKKSGNDAAQERGSAVIKSPSSDGIRFSFQKKDNSISTRKTSKNSLSGPTTFSSPVSSVSISQSQSPSNRRSKTKARRSTFPGSSDDERNMEEETSRRTGTGKIVNNFSLNKETPEGGHGTQEKPQPNSSLGYINIPWKGKKKQLKYESSSDESEAPKKTFPARALAARRASDFDSDSDSDHEARSNTKGTRTLDHSIAATPNSVDPKEGSHEKLTHSADEDTPGETSSRDRKVDQTPKGSCSSQTSSKRRKIPSPKSASPRKRSRIPLNPIDGFLRQNEESMRLARENIGRNAALANSDDLLLTDDEGDHGRGRVTTSNFTTRQPSLLLRGDSVSLAGGSGEENDSDDELMEEMEGGHRNKRGAHRSLPGTGPNGTVDTEVEYASSSDSEEEMLPEEANDLMEKLHPELANPAFGPFELKPLMLSDRHHVPAALNRYLLGYQRDGIQFLYNSISSGKGAILADDMGLGKTIQVISTLAAFFGKTGTELDREILKFREKQVAFFRSNLNERKERGFYDGKIITPEIENREIEKFRTKKLKLSRLIPVLVIVPAVVVDNWEYEFTLWGHFSVARYREQSNRDEALDAIKYGSAEVLLCPHSLFSSKDHFKYINATSWRLVVIDEFHVMKSDDSDIFKNMTELKADHKCAVIGLTGTPLQNRHSELFNLLEIIRPGHFGTWKNFQRKFARPILLSRTRNATPESLQHGERVKEELDRELKPIYMRRIKTEVLKDMPEKFELLVRCELSDLQKRVYEGLLNQPDYIVLRGANSPCDCGVNVNFFAEYRRLQTNEEKIEYQRKNDFRTRSKCCFKMPLKCRNGPVDENAVLWKHQHKHLDGDGCKYCPSCIFLPALTKLYQLSSHVTLLQVDRNDKNIKGHEREKAEDFARVAFPPEVRDKLPGGDIYRQDSCWDDHFAMSGKIKELHNLLSTIAKKKGRVLLFSYSTRTLDVIENYLKGEEAVYKFLRIDGQTPAKDRQGLVDTFQTDSSYFLMLLSTRAAGVGLNLTAANYVIIFDCEWNPALDSQAQDRSFRIGQKKDVTVYRLVAQGTIDELKYMRQIYKLQLKEETFRSDGSNIVPRLFKGVEKDKERKGELFGIENLLNFERNSSFMEKICKFPAKKSRSASSDKVEAHDVRDVALAIQNGDTCGLDQQEVAVRKVIEECARELDEEDLNALQVREHNDFLVDGRVEHQDDPEQIMGGETQQNDYFIMNFRERSTGLSQVEEARDIERAESGDNKKAEFGGDTKDGSEAKMLNVDTKQPQSVGHVSMGARSAWDGDDEWEEPQAGAEAEMASPSSTKASTKKKATASAKKPSPIKGINFQICGIAADQIRGKKATFGKSDFFLPK